VRTLLIVDDHPAFRESAAAMFSAHGFTVVGTAEDGTHALEAAHRLRPDIVLLDVQLPDIDGFVVARALATQADPPCIVMTSSRDEADYGDRLPAAGTQGFIAKRALSGSALTALLASAAH